MTSYLACVIPMTVLLGANPVSAQAPGGFEITRPTGGAAIGTPLTATIEWTSSKGAKSYDVSVIESGVKTPVVRFLDLRATDCKLALKPSTTYKVTVTARSKTGSAVASNAPLSFSTPDPKLAEVTDTKVLFAGWFPSVHFVHDEAYETDPNAKISPWYSKKAYDQSPPPSFDQAKPNLPIPIWDGHDDAIDMYWYAWKTLFTTWLYPPHEGKNMAVSNLLGMPTWAGWGSTMVWDSAFILQFARYAHKAYPVITAIDNCYARQHENGFICRESENHNEEVNAYWPVNLPLLAWCEWSNYRLTGDRMRLEQVFLPLVKQYEWYMLYQRRANGLYWNVGVGDGMDNSPRNPLAHYWQSVTSCMALSAEALSEMAEIVGREDMAKWFAGDYRRLSDLVNANFWDRDHRIYNDLGVDGKPITNTAEGGMCKTVFSFWPMIAGIATPERAACLASHLANAEEFNLPCGTATLSRDSRDFDRDRVDGWRGAVWPPTQYMVTEGLKRCGNEALANRLALKYYEAFMTAYKAKGDITEYIEPEKPVMRGYRQFVGWGGIAPISILIEDIIGIRADAPSNTVVWRLRRTEKHGIRNLSFGDRTVSLVCEARSDIRQPAKIEVESSAAFTLIVKHATGETRIEVTKGRSSLEVGTR